MGPATAVLSLPASAFRRWRSLRPRARIALGVLAASALLAGFWLADRLQPDSWPARAVLKTPMATWPLAFSPDGKTFATFGRGGITPWDVDTGRKRETWAVAEGGAAVTGAFSPDGKTFAAAVFYPTQTVSIELYDTATGRKRAELFTNSPSVFRLAFTDDGRSLRTFLGSVPVLAEVVTWDASTAVETSRRPISAPTRSGMTEVSPDGSTLAIGASKSPAVQLWDVATDRTGGGLVNLATTSPVAWGGIGLSRDGRALAIGREDGTIELWDVPTRRIIKTFRAHSGDYGSSMIRFSPDGKTLASTGHRWGRKSPLGAIQDDIRRRLGANPSDDSELIVLDVATGERLARSMDSIHPFYSPDGRTLATRERDFSVQLRDVPSDRSGAKRGGP